MGTEEPINILMVDDSPTNLLALESILHTPDRNLVSAPSGDDALRYLLNNEVAVILMDVYMPGLDGLETAELIRRRDRSRNIPIIFLTADSTGGRHLSRGYSLGAVDYIVKPIEPDILRSKVAVFVELFKKTREVKRQADLLEEKNQQLENANLARLNMLINLGQELAAEHHPARVLEKFCHSARQIVEAQESGVAVINQDCETLRYFFRSTATEETISDNGVPPVAEQALKYLVTHRRPLRLTDTDELLRTNGKTSDLVHSFLGAPILSRAGVCGWIYLLNKLNADDFSEADERLAATLATQVASAYENAMLYSDAQRHAVDLQLEIAERKQAEEERARLLIRERAARAEAEQANQTKDEFLATLSHELRTPLSAILGWSHLIRSGKLDEGQLMRAFETIERNARSQSQLIDDLLDVSRIITGKLEIEARPLDLCGVIEAAGDAVRPSVEAKGIQFEMLLDAEACVVRGDANRLQQIFWNLLSNAIKFTPAGGSVSVAVRPAGPVQSEGKDKGATFIVSLPLAPAEFAAAVERSKPTKPESNGLPAGFSKLLKGLRILVVDDEVDSRDLVSAILTRCGGKVRCCQSAAEALKTFREWKPDLLVSDIGMPQEDGYALIKKLRKLRIKLAKQIPAVALTAYATEDDRTLTLSAGFQTHVAKPIEPEALVRIIAGAAGRKI